MSSDLPVLTRSTCRRPLFFQLENPRPSLHYRNSACQSWELIPTSTRRTPQPGGREPVDKYSNLEGPGRIQPQREKTFFTCIPSFPISLPPLLLLVHGITSQINYHQPSLDLSLCFLGNPSKDVTQHLRTSSSSSFVEGFSDTVPQGLSWEERAPPRASEAQQRAPHLVSESSSSSSCHMLPFHLSSLFRRTCTLTCWKTTGYQVMNVPSKPWR